MKFAAKLLFISYLSATWITSLGWHDLTALWITSLILSIVAGFFSMAFDRDSD